MGEVSRFRQTDTLSEKRLIRKMMDVIYQKVAALDVHEATVVACRRRLIAGCQAEVEVKTFKTTSAELRALRQWLIE